MRFCGVALFVLSTKFLINIFSISTYPGCDRRPRYVKGVITILVPRIDLNNPGTDVHNSGHAVFTILGPRKHLFVRI